MYPLKHTPLIRLFPYLCCFLKCCKLKPNLRRADERDTFFGQHSESLAQGSEVLADSFKDDDYRLDKVIKESKGKAYEGTDFVQDSMAKFNHENEAKAKSSEKTHDPMALYGFGVTAYFKLLTALIFVLVILSLKAAAIAYLYHEYDNETDLSTASAMGKLVYTSSMAKMPQAST